MRESKREVLREARGLGGAVVHARWALTDRGGVGRFSHVTLEDSNGPTVTIMAGTWTFDQVTLRVTSKHAWLLCVTSLGMSRLSLFHLGRYASSLLTPTLTSFFWFAMFICECRQAFLVLQLVFVAAHDSLLSCFAHDRHLPCFF